MRKTNIMEKPFTCGYCEKKFNRKDNLNTHLKIHTRSLDDTGSTRNECNHLEAMYRAEFSMQILGSYRKSKPKDEQIDW